MEYIVEIMLYPAQFFQPVVKRAYMHFMIAYCLPVISDGVQPDIDKYKQDQCYKRQNKGDRLIFNYQRQGKSDSESDRRF